MGPPRGKRLALLFGIPCLAILALAAWPLGRLLTERIYLARNVERFTKVISPTYSPWSNELGVQYFSGAELRRDLLYPKPLDPRYIGWRAPLLRSGSQFLFSANTVGAFLLPFPLDDVQVDTTIWMGTTDSSGSLSVLLGASADGKRYVAAIFGTIEVWEEGQRKSMHLPSNVEYQTSPNSWFPKDQAVGMRIRLEQLPGGKQARVTIWFDTEGQNQIINSALVPAWRGRVGFSWNRVKFLAHKLRITGRLDGPEAVKVLERMPPAAQKQLQAVRGPSI